MTTRRLFVAHPKSLPDEDLDDFLNLIKNAFAGKKLPDGSPIALEITTGRMSAALWERNHRGLPFYWTAWQELVAGTTQTFGGEPNFHYFVVGPWTVIGKATAELVLKALARGRQVLYLNDHKLVRVSGVEKTSSNSWKSGWRVVTS